MENAKLSNFMKTLLTLFVLLFSSSVVAYDDLTGKKLFCVVSATKVYNMAINFHSNDKVNIFLSQLNSQIYTFKDLKYLALPSRISIFNNDFTYRIDRKSLNLIEVDNNKKENSLAICNLVEGNIMKLLRETMNQQITKLKEGNKI